MMVSKVRGLMSYGSCSGLGSSRCEYSHVSRLICSKSIYTTRSCLCRANSGNSLELIMSLVHRIIPSTGHSLRGLWFAQAHSTRRTSGPWALTTETKPCERASFTSSHAPGSTHFCPSSMTYVLKPAFAAPSAVSLTQ